MEKTSIKNKTYEDYFYIYKKNIYELADKAYKQIYGSTDGTNITDVNDLIIVANLKLLELYNLGKAEFTNYTLRAIENALTDEVRKVAGEVNNKNTGEEHKKEPDKAQLIRDANEWLNKYDESGIQVSQILAINFLKQEKKKFDIDPLVYKISLIFISKILFRHLIGLGVIDISQAKILFLKIAFDKTFREVSFHLPITFDKANKDYYKSLFKIAYYFYSLKHWNCEKIDFGKINKNQLKRGQWALRRKSGRFCQYDRNLEELIENLMYSEVEKKLANCPEFKELNLKDSFLYTYLVGYDRDIDDIGIAKKFECKNIFEKAYLYRTILKDIQGYREIILRNVKNYPKKIGQKRNSHVKDIDNLIGSIMKETEKELRSIKQY